MTPDRRLWLQRLGASALLGAAATLAGKRASADEALAPVAFVVPSLGDPLFAACRAGGEEATKDIGSIAFAPQAGAKATAADQVRLVTALLTGKTAAVAIDAVDAGALAPVCRKAMQRGVPIIGFGTRLPRDARRLQVEPFARDAAGPLVLRLMAKSLSSKGLGGKGRVGLLAPAGEGGTALVAAVKREWVKPAYDGLKLAAVATADARNQVSAAEAMLKANADIDGLLALDGATLVAAAHAGGSRKLAVTGLGQPSQMQDFVKSGTVAAFAFWNPLDLGYCATMLAGLAATGVLAAAPETMVSVGRLGLLTIGKDLSVDLGAPTMVDGSNIDRYAKAF